MSLKITIFDGVIPMLDEIAEANYGQGLDALDHAGIVLRTAQRTAFKSSRTQWRQSYIKGKRRIFKTTSSNILGNRVSHQTRSNRGRPSSMANFITSNLMEKSMIMVVGGKHGKLSPKLRRDGKVIGLAKPVSSVTKGSYAILQKLNNGSIATDKNYYANSVRRSSMKGFKRAKYLSQNFVEKGRLVAMPAVRQIMTSKLESMIHKQINRANIKVKEVVTA